MAKGEVKTAWYRNIEQGTTHEVVVGSDHEKRIRKAQRQVGDTDDYEPLYEKVSESEGRKNAKDQPGYVTPKNVAASPAVHQMETVPQTPTADTARGPLVGEPGAEAQAEAEEDLGGAPPGGVKKSATAADKSKKK